MSLRRPSCWYTRLCFVVVVFIRSSPLEQCPPIQPLCFRCTFFVVVPQTMFVHSFQRIFPCQLVLSRGFVVGLKLQASLFSDSSQGTRSGKAFSLLWRRSHQVPVGKGPREEEVSSATCQPLRTISVPMVGFATHDFSGSTTRYSVLIRNGHVGILCDLGGCWWWY